MNPRLSSFTSIALITLLSLVNPFSGKVIAQLLTNSLSSQLPTQWEFQPPDNIGAPSHRQGGATRGECLPEDQFLTLLVPTSGSALTAQGYPTFFWHIPNTEAQAIEFILKNDQNQEVYATRYLLPKTAGSAITPAQIMSLKLPALTTLTPLEVGKEYQWELVLSCELNDRSADVAATAKIKRVSLNPIFSNQIETASPQEKVVLYANQRLWYETVETLDELRRNNPNDSILNDAWQKLLKSVDLNQINSDI